MSKELTDFDELNCPYCDTLCKPVSIARNGKVTYETHKCGLYFWVKTFKRNFKINKNWDLVV